MDFTANNDQTISNRDRNLGTWHLSNTGRSDMTLTECPTLLTEKLFSYTSMGTFTPLFKLVGNTLHSNLASLGTFLALTLALTLAFISVLTLSPNPPCHTFPVFVHTVPVLPYYFISQIKHSTLPDPPGNHCWHPLGVSS